MEQNHRATHVLLDSSCSCEEIDGGAAGIVEVQPPRIWVLTSDRIGDNAQAIALADALMEPYAVKAFGNRFGAITANFILGPVAPGLVTAEPSTFRPPWPDLVIAAGVQSEPVCALLRERARREGRYIRTAFLGRPWLDPHHYDVIITTPQYQVPPGSNVIAVDFPFHRVDRTAALAQAEKFAPLLGGLPPPYIAILIGGGAVNRYSFDRHAARRLAQVVNERSAKLGGSLLVTSSFRTPTDSLAFFKKHLSRPSLFFDWHKPTPLNPYLAFLGLAERIIVTGDSITMLAEACEAGKPVDIFDLGEGRFSMHQNNTVRWTGKPDWVQRKSLLRAFLKDAKVRLISKVLPTRLHRDTREMHQRLVLSGHASWIGEERLLYARFSQQESLKGVAARIRTLLSHTEKNGRHQEIQTEGAPIRVQSSTSRV